MKLIIVIFFTFLIVGCKQSEEVYNENDFMSSSVNISTKVQFEIKINNFLNNIKNGYSFNVEKMNYENSYALIYYLYDIKNLTQFNEIDPIATFSVYFESEKDDALIVDLLYTFPLNDNESINNLEIEYNLYIELIKSIIDSSEEDVTEIIRFFNMNTFNDYKKIYNEEIDYGFKNVDMGENGGNYMSTLFARHNRSITFEYHDGSFIE